MRRFLSLFLAVIMCVSMIPMTLIDALAHGPGVAGNNIENQSLTNMSQLPEQVNVDGKTGDTAWDELKWNVADSATGTWDVKDPLNYDYSYKYQLRMDGEYFYGIIVLSEAMDATVKVMLNDGTKADGYTSCFTFAVKDSVCTPAYGFVDDTPLAQEMTKTVCKSTSDNRFVIEFKTLLRNFTASSSLTSFVSVSIEGVEGEETLYYPRVPYSDATASNEEVAYPTDTEWPANSIRVDLVDITSETKNNNANVLPSMIDIDGEFKESAWDHLSNYFTNPLDWRNAVDFKNGDISETPLAYEVADISSYRSVYTFANDNIGSEVASEKCNFKYTYYFDNEYLYFGAVYLDEDTNSNTEPVLYLYTHYGDYPTTSSDNTLTPKNTIVISRFGEEAWFHEGLYDSFPGEATKNSDKLKSNVFYLDANLWGFELQIPIESIWGDGCDANGLSFSMKISSYDGTRGDSDNDGINDTFTQNGAARYSAAAYVLDSVSGNGLGSSHSYYSYGHSIHIDGIQEYKTKYGALSLGGYDSGEFGERAFANMIAAEAGVNGSYIGTGAGKGKQLYADMVADYDYLYGAAIINTESFNSGTYGDNNVDVFRVYIKDTEDGQNTLPKGGDGNKKVIEPCDRYLSFYFDDNVHPRVVLTEHKDTYDNRGLTEQWKDPLTDGAGKGYIELTNADVAMKRTTLADGTVQVLVEFRVPLQEIGVNVEYGKTYDSNMDILNWRVSVENLKDYGGKGLVYPHTGNYDFFYTGDQYVSTLTLRTFYLNYWHEQNQGCVKYDRYKEGSTTEVDEYYFLDTIKVDGKLDEAFWDGGDMITVSQYNGVWANEPQTSEVFSYNYKIYNAPDHIYGAALVDFPADAETTKFKFWTKRDGQTPKYVTITVDKNGTAHATVTANGTEYPITEDILVKATSINNQSVIEFMLKNDRDNLGAYNYAVSVTHITEEGEELTLYHLGNKDGWENLWQTHYNAGPDEGVGVIYTKNDFVEKYPNEYFDYYLFAPADGYGKGVYEVKAVQHGADKGGASTATLFADHGDVIPEGWFVYCINLGNRRAFDYTSSNAENGYVIYREDFTVGQKIYFVDVDLENFEKLYTLSDSNIDYYESGYYNTAKYKVHTTVEYRGNANIPSATVWHENALKVETLTYYNREVIEIDGSLGDSGWDDGRWIDVNGDVNGTFQSYDYYGADKATYKYQMRTDGKYIYVAAVIDTDEKGQYTEWKEGETDVGTKVTDLPSFRIWIKGDDDDNGESITFTHLYDVSLNTVNGANSYTLEGVEYISPYTNAADEDGAMTESYAYAGKDGRDYYTLTDGKLAPKALYTGANNTALYPQLRFAKTNELGWYHPHGGNSKVVFDENGIPHMEVTKDDIKSYTGDLTSAIFGYTERIEENTTNGANGTAGWYSKPITNKITFGNEHGMIKYYDTYEGTENGAIVVEFKIGLDEIDKDKSGFEYFVHASNSGYGDTNPFTAFYPSMAQEPLSSSNFMMYNLPYWKWYSENSYKVDTDEYAYMMLRDSYGPVTTLGAKIIADYYGDEDGDTAVKAIRFGAFYNEKYIRWPENVNNVSDNVSGATLDADLDNVLNYWDIAEVGMLIAPTVLIPDSAPLTHATTLLNDSKYLDAVADPITGWVKGSNLADYETMVFHVPLKNIPDDGELKFTFVPYVDYYDANGTETYYGISAERSYNYVYNALGGTVDVDNENVSKFWITHINEYLYYGDVPGAGMVFTEDYSKGINIHGEEKDNTMDWWMHIAFAPTAIDGVYEIIQILDGTPGGDNAGKAAPIEIPEGGFVWVGHNSKNDVGGSDTGSDEAIELARTWSVGEYIEFYGWNLDDSYNIPTTTPTLDYTDPKYICTATVEAHEVQYVYDEDVVAYIPLDDRPVNLDREILAAEGADFTILTPDLEDIQTQVNKKIVSAEHTFVVTEYDGQINDKETVIFTELDNHSSSGYNIYVSFAPTSDGMYEVVYISDGAGGDNDGKAVFPTEMPENGFILGANSSTGNPAVKAAKTWRVGDKIWFSGLSLTDKTAGTTVLTSNNNRPRTDCLYANEFNITDGYSNGSTVIYTDENALNSITLGGYNTFAVFKPYLAVPNTYELVSISDGTDGSETAGAGVKPTSIPEGGFVWAGNGTTAASGTLRTLETLRKLSAGDIVSFDIDVTSGFSSVFIGLDIDDSAPGKRENTYAWIKDIYENGISATVENEQITITRPKYYVFSLDQLVSGGLAGSRNFSIIDEYYDLGKTVDENFATYEDDVVEFLTDLACDDGTYVVAFDTIMRLATATSDFFGLGDYYDATRHKYGVADRKVLSGDELTLENVIKYMPLDASGNEIDYTQAENGGLDAEFMQNVYFPSRERKVRFTSDMLTALYDAGASFDKFYIGIDDTVPAEEGKANVQSNEISFINKLITDYGMSETTSVFDGADELGMLGISAVSVDREKETVSDSNEMIPVNTVYFGSGADKRGGEYDSMTLRESVNAHLIGAGAYTVDTDAELEVLVLTRCTAAGDYNVDSFNKDGSHTDEYLKQEAAVNELVERLKSNFENDVPTIIINAQGNGDCRALLHNAMANADLDIAKLYGYSQWNTIGNTVGLAIGMGVSRYAYVKSCSKQGTEPTLESNLKFLESLTTALVKDIAYKMYGVANYATKKDELVEWINGSDFYDKLGHAVPNYSVSVEMYETLDSWDNRTFEAQIPVTARINYA